MAETNIVTWVIDGTTRVDVDFFALSGKDWRDARRATGLTQVALVESALVAKEIESIGTFIWLVQRREDPSVTFESVLGGLSIGNLIQDEEVSDGGA